MGRLRCDSWSARPMPQERRARNVKYRGSTMRAIDFVTGGEPALRSCSHRSRPGALSQAVLAIVAGGEPRLTQLWLSQLTLRPDMRSCGHRRRRYALLCPVVAILGSHKWANRGSWAT